MLPRSRGGVDCGLQGAALEIHLWGYINDTLIDNGVAFCAVCSCVGCIL